MAAWNCHPRRLRSRDGSPAARARERKMRKIKVKAVRENAGYLFISANARGAQQKCGVKSISLLREVVPCFLAGVAAGDADRASRPGVVARKSSRSFVIDKCSLLREPTEIS